MYDLDLEKLNRSLVKSVKLIVAVRRMLSPEDAGLVEVGDLEREIREAASECQRVLGLVDADAHRPVITG